MESLKENHERKCILSMNEYYIITSFCYQLINEGMN